MIEVRYAKISVLLGEGSRILGNVEGTLTLRLKLVLASSRGLIKIKMRDPGIRNSISNVENDGSINFSINQKTSVQVSVSVSNRIRVTRFQVWRANHYTFKVVEQKNFKDALEL